MISVIIRLHSFFYSFGKLQITLTHHSFAWSRWICTRYLISFPIETILNKFTNALLAHKFFCAFLTEIAVQFLVSWWSWEPEIDGNVPGRPSRREIVFENPQERPISAGNLPLLVLLTMAIQIIDWHSNSHWAHWPIVCIQTLTSISPEFLFVKLGPISLKLKVNSTSITWNTFESEAWNSDLFYLHHESKLIISPSLSFGILLLLRLNK